MGPNAQKGNPQNLQNLQNHSQMTGLGNSAGGLPGGKGASGGVQHGAVHAVRADLHAALLAGVNSGRLPASAAVQYSAGLPQSLAGSTGVPAPSRRKQSPLLSLSSFDRGTWGSAKRQSDAANTPSARTTRSGAEEPPMLLTTTDLTQGGNAHSAAARDRRPSTDVSAPAAASSAGGAALARGGSSAAALAALTATAQQQSAAASEDALQTLMSALQNGSNATERERATAALARALEGQGMSAQQPRAGVAASAPPPASLPPAATDIAADVVVVKQEATGDIEMKASDRKVRGLVRLSVAVLCSL